MTEQLIKSINVAIDCAASIYQVGLCYEFTRFRNSLNIYNNRYYLDYRIVPTLDDFNLDILRFNLRLADKAFPEYEHELKTIKDTIEQIEAYITMIALTEEN
ncbi:MAG: hypothetical protein K0R18_1295 [Bacillales bacterium]|jgi:hypothetical protein|nr:hypothetical protein [Bacillales bacterium]